MALFKINNIDTKRCGACENCVQVCPENCIDIAHKDGKVYAEITKNIKKCDCCGKCLIACNQNAFILKELDTDKKAYVVDPEKCEACEHCVKVTKGRGFEMVETNGKIHSKVKDHEEIKHHCFKCPNDAIVYME